MIKRKTANTVLASLGLLVSCGDSGSDSPTRIAFEGNEIERLACTPNLDGRIDAGEIGVALGVPVAYRISPTTETREVDVAGEVANDGVRLWDWSSDDATDQSLSIQPSAITDHWFRDRFPTDAEFVLPHTADGRTVAVFSQDALALWLWGFASNEEQPAEGQTLLRYSTPVPLYRFPVTQGSTWEATGEVTNGLFRNLPYAAHDRYELAVDAAGRLVLPDLTFTQVHRLRTRLTVTPAIGTPTAVRQASFLFECFGEVARATSRANEGVADFTTAAEVRRLGL